MISEIQKTMRQSYGSPFKASLCIIAGSRCELIEFNTIVQCPSKASMVTGADRVPDGQVSFTSPYHFDGAHAAHGAPLASIDVPRTVDLLLWQPKEAVTTPADI